MNIEMKSINGSVILILVILSHVCFVRSIRHYTKDDVYRLREEVREMFQHAYNGYLTHASSYDELRPLSCDGIDTWGKYSLTLIDALDTLIVMGNHTEFRRVVKLLEDIDFDTETNVSVFETNIRIVGGLLSAHLLSHRAFKAHELEPGWPCNGPLLRMAEDVARRLLPAFDTKTGMPYGTVNLRKGVPVGETSVTCTAGIGTFIVEFGALTRLTGDPVYEEVALNALHSLYEHRSQIDLFGNHIDVQTGRWTALDAGIGAGVDSYYEYLVKGSIMLNRPELMDMFIEGRKAIDKYLKREDWHVWVSMNKGQVTLPVFQSLEAYWPGVLSMVGDTAAAMKSLHNYHSVWKQYGFLPEFFNIPNAEAGTNRENYPLRPELIESVMYLYRATGDPYLLEVGEDILRSIQHSARTPCGYATIKNVRDHRKDDRMESFFLAETTKYLYLLFDPDNFLNNDGGVGTIIDTPNGECIIDAGGFIFNTEAHPIDSAALKCCFELPRESWFPNYDRKKFQGDIFNRTAGRRDADESTDTDEETIPKTTHTIEITKDDLATREHILSEIIRVMKDRKEQKAREERGEPEELSVADLKRRGDSKDDDEVVANSDINPEGPESNSNAQDTKAMTDDSLIVLDEKRTVEKISVKSIDAENAEASVEILKLSTNRTPDGNTTPKVDESEAGELFTLDSESSADMKSDDDVGFIVNTSSSDMQIDKNNPTLTSSNKTLLAEFVQSIIATTFSETRPQFDVQELLVKIRSQNSQRLVSRLKASHRYELLTCKSQPFLQRISILGEFY